MIRPSHLVKPHSHQSLTAPHHTELKTVQSPLLASAPLLVASDSALLRWCGFPVASSACSSFCLGPLPSPADTKQHSSTQV